MTTTTTAMFQKHDDDDDEADDNDTTRGDFSTIVIELNLVKYWINALIWRYGGGNTTAAERVSRFQCLFPNPKLVGVEGHPITKNSLQFSLG